MLAWQIRVDELLDSRVELPCDHLCQRHPGALLKPQIERKTDQWELFIFEELKRFHAGRRMLISNWRAGTDGAAQKVEVD